MEVPYVCRESAVVFTLALFECDSACKGAAIRGGAGGSSQVRGRGNGRMIEHTEAGRHTTRQACFDHMRLVH
jgi:hypothetical protein